MPNNKPKKPVKKYNTHKMYNFHECRDYIEAKYKIQTRGYPNYEFGKENAYPYQDFWHWLLEHDACDIHNPDTFLMETARYMEEEETPVWVKEILKMFQDEFEEEEIEFYISW